jgi:hypothetical protein
MAEDRPLRNCMGCGKTDTAPRDVVGLPDGNTAYWHMDCHVLATNCPVCKAVLDTAGGFGSHLKDDALVDHLTDPEVTSQHEIFTTDDARGFAEKVAEDK